MKPMRFTLLLLVASLTACTQSLRKPDGAVTTPPTVAEKRSASDAAIAAHCSVVVRDVQATARQRNDYCTCISADAANDWSITPGNTLLPDHVWLAAWLRTHQRNRDACITRLGAQDAAEKAQAQEAAEKAKVQSTALRLNALCLQGTRVLQGMDRDNACRCISNRAAPDWVDATGAGPTGELPRWFRSWIQIHQSAMEACL
jgi:hypothetical protein